MSNGKGGFIGQDGLNAPDQATDVAGTAGNASVSVAFTAPSDVGASAITGYRVTDSTGAFGASGTSSPVNVTGLTNGTSYTFNVWAINPFGYSSPSDASGGVTPSIPYGIINGGFISSGAVNNISRFVFTTTGNASDFGDLTTTSYQSGACASNTRGLRGGGQTTGTGSSDVNTIDYVTIASAGDATDYGDLVATTRYGVACSNSTRGLFWGGRLGTGATSNVIQYVTISSTGNATDFGDMLANDYSGGAVASPTRGVHITGSLADTMQYVTIATTGNATDFGNIVFGDDFNPGGVTASSNSTRGVFSGFLQKPIWTTSNVIQYITIASTGDSSDFGDLTVARNYGASATGGDRAVFISGQSSGSSFTNTIDYVTVTSTGNATDFGDLPYSTYSPSASSAAHGGL
jgi:hypothetical protein